MLHLGDVSKIHGGKIPPVDIITFGSPCQDLSVAGKRAGLKHDANGDEETTRSGLFMEAVRIIKEMREATNGESPRWALWENVPGAYSSNKGEDFRVVLEELIKIVEPSAEVPPAPKGGWPYADAYVGDGWSLAYRTFDAQYWGVPQRRRRIYLIADFAGGRAPGVLFERKGLRGYFTEGRTPWERTAAAAERGSGADDRVGESGITPLCMATQQGGSEIMEDKCPTITAAAGTSGNNQPIVALQTRPRTFIIDNIGGQSEYGKESQVNGTLRAGGQGAVAHPNVMAGLDCEQVSHTLIARMSSAVGTTQDHLIITEKHSSRYIVRRLTPTECARLQGFDDLWVDIDKKENFTEDEYRFWLDVRNTHAEINGRAVKEYTKEQMLKWYNKLHSKSAEYKMWGNGVALPPTLYVMQGIQDAIAS